ncbi:hypothetical protein AGMMS50225_27200 [Betaproteobacteria bacterium]|nr:hypothetical protein AGMMS50225_27200 [Betaproteobacteria bacterium]
MNTALEFDVLLSFAGPERPYARAIHDIVSANGLRVFLDEEFQHEIWGKNLVEYLDKAYRERGRFVVALLSRAYREKAFTKVERHAAFDRMINESAEYLLPVKVDDSWIDGLPKSTAYLDLRTAGVLGVCELLLKKIRGSTTKLVIPNGLRIPRVPSGSIPSSQVTNYLLEMCARPQITLFGALIYDETNIALRRLLIDPISWDALDKASGQNLEVFAVRDTEQYGSDDNVYIKLMTATSLGRERDRGYYYSKLLHDYFGEKKTRLAYPSFLLFTIENRQVQKCWLIPFRRASTEETLNRLIDLFTSINKALADAGGVTASSKDVLSHLKEVLLEHKYKLYIQSGPRDVEHAVRELTAYIES